MNMKVQLISVLALLVSILLASQWSVRSES